MKLKGFFARISLCVLLSAPVAANATVITLDNGGAGFSSSGFTNSAFNSGYFGAGYMVDRVNKSGDFAIWDPTSNIDWFSGLWTVEIIWTSSTNRATGAHFSVNSGSAVTDLFVNQTVDGGTWFELGTYDFAATGVNVKVDDSMSARNQYVIADAVRFTSVAASPAVVSAPASLGLMLLSAFGLFSLRRKQS